MMGDSSFTGFESLVGKILKTESAGVERCCLFGISDPEGDVVESENLSVGWTL